MKRLSAFFLLILLLGCGPAPGRKKAVIPSEDSSGSAALEFKPRIVHSMASDPKFPDSSDGSRQEIIAQNRKLIFPEVFSVPSDLKKGSRPLFLIFDQEGFSSKILDVYYTYQKRDSDNHRQGDFERKNASYDQQSRRWFIPLLTLLNMKAEDLDPSEAHLVGLELHMEDQNVVQLDLEFRARGPLPEVHPNVSKVTFDHGALLGQLASNRSFVYAREEYFNPARRPMRLWLNAVGAPLDLTAYLIVPRYTGAGDGDYHWESFSSSTQLQIKQVRVTRAGSTTTLDLPESAPLGIQLEAGATVTVEWLVSPLKGAAFCQIPGAYQHRFQWETVYTEIIGGGGHGTGWERKVERRTPHDVTRTESFSFHGASLHGVWERSVVLAQLYVRHADLRPGDSSQVLIQEKLDYSHPRQMGEVPGGVQNFGCQGVLIN